MWFVFVFVSFSTLFHTHTHTPSFFHLSSSVNLPKKSQKSSTVNCMKLKRKGINNRWYWWCLAHFSRSHTDSHNKIIIIIIVAKRIWIDCILEVFLVFILLAVVAVPVRECVCVFRAMLFYFTRMAYRNMPRSRNTCIPSVFMRIYI